MKKLTVILVTFGIVVIAMICEIVYVNKFYNGLQTDLERIAESIDENEQNVDNAETTRLCDNLLKKWEKGRDFLLTVQNHNTVRGLDDKIISLAAVVRSDNYNDAVIFAHSAINYIDDVLLDSMPYISNIL